MKDIWPSLLTLNLEEGGHESKNAGTALTNSQQGDRNFNPTTTRDCNSHLNEQRNRFSSRASVKEHSPADSLMLACWAHIGYRELWDDKHVLFKLLRLWWLLYSNRKPIDHTCCCNQAWLGLGDLKAPFAGLVVGARYRLNHSVHMVSCSQGCEPGLLYLASSGFQADVNTAARVLETLLRTPLPPSQSSNSEGLSRFKGVEKSFPPRWEEMKSHSGKKQAMYGLEGFVAIFQNLLSHESLVQ